MEYKLSVNWQEDSSSPTGQMYTVSVTRLNDSPLTETKHSHLDVAWIDALGDLRKRGEW